MGFTSYKTDHGFWCIEDGGVRAFLFEGQDKALLADSTFSEGLSDYVKALTDKPVELITTHADGDHTGSAAEFPVQYMHPSEFDYYQRRGIIPDNLHPIWDGDILDIGAFKFEIVHIPGHTPGSIMLLEREKRFAIGGDTVQSGAIFMFGPGRNFRALIASYYKLLQMAGDFDVIYSSHGELMISPDIIKDLIDGAERYLAGGAEYVDGPDRLPPSVKQYNIGKAHFFAE